MNKELWQKFDQLRACNLNGSDAIQMLVQKEGIRFFPKDISTWSRFFSQSVWMGGHLIVPDWLATVFGALAHC
jgi:hypothetical protein